jgi:TolB-like protein/Tfp pilus assembly protein PilF
MAPEQARGQEADHRSDIFSFGATLYEMLSGGRAFPGESAADVLTAILREQPPDLSSSGVSVPPVLERIVGRCLEKSPAERFQSARDLAFALEAISDVGRDSSSSRAFYETVGSDPQEESPSIAVLPFADMSPAKDHDYFCEGMAEEIINALTKIEGLQVASRSSAFRFKGLAQDIRSVGETLNVKTVLEGSVRTAGKRLRVTTQLVNVKDGYHLWSERYDRQMEDVFDIQDEISQSIVDALRVKLVGAKETARGRQTSNLEAYHLYLKGQHNWYRREKDSLQKAAQFFEEAAHKDPSYVLAHTGLANAYSSLGYYGLHHDIAYPKAKAAMERAQSINDDLAEVHAAQGLMRLWLEWDWDGSEQSFKKAISIDPEYVLAYCWYSFALDAKNRHDEALRMAERARELDPLSPYTNTCIGFCLLQQGRYEEAIRATKKALEMEPDFLYTHWVLGGAYTLNSQHDEGLSMLERAATLSGRASYYLSWLACFYGVAGRREQALKVIGELDERARVEYVSAMFFAWAYGGLGDADQTFAWLEKAVDEHSSQIGHAASLPLLAVVQSTPRFGEFLGRLKLPNPKQ